MTTYAIVETDIYGDTLVEDDGSIFYLNHAYLNPNRPGFGSMDMAWTTESLLEAEGMSARIERKKPRHKVIEI